MFLNGRIFYKYKIGWNPLVLHVLKIVKKIANPTKIWLGIDCCAPMAFFNNEKTTVILVNDVNIIINDGNNVNIVKNISIFKIKFFIFTFYFIIII